MELDESGMPVAKEEDEASSRIKVKKKMKAPKHAETTDAAAGPEQDPSDGTEEAAQKNTGTDKKTVQKKIVRKKTTTKKKV